MMTRTKAATKIATIDFLPSSAFRYRDHDAVICLDSMLTTTTLVTAAEQGRRAYPSASRAEAINTSRRLCDPLLAGDGAACVAGHFELRNSPSALLDRDDHDRPLVLAGGAGAELLLNAAGAGAVYVACFRNLEATAAWVGARHRRVAILGSGSDGRVRCEDQMAAARLARTLLGLGFQSERADTLDIVSRWADADLALAGLGSSAERLRAARQHADVDFVLSHEDDLDLVCRLHAGEPGGSAYVAAVDQQLVPVPVRALTLLHAV
jgi:phosphosulfolactate phosphohydrolase-like enzyme